MNVIQSAEFIFRLKNEYEELNIKILALKMFIRSDEFKELSIQHKTLIEEQIKFMNKYKEILVKRQILIN